MRRAVVGVLTVAMFVAAVGCGNVDNSVEKPTDPVPPPKNAVSDGPTTTTGKTVP